MESTFETVFERHTQLLLERVRSQHRISDAKNKALKCLYVIVRDALSNVIKAAKKSDVTSKNYHTKFEKFLSKYEASNGYIETVDSKTIRVSIPEHIQKELKSLQKTLLIKIVTEDAIKMKAGNGEIAGAGLETNDKTGKVVTLYVRIDLLLNNFTKYKSAIQHEIQHVVSPTKVEGLTEKGDELEKFISYMGDVGEIAAYTKEFAYLYFKKYPRDKKLNFDKFKSEFYKKSDAVLNNYISFGEDIDGLKENNDVSDSQVRKMKNIYSEFVSSLKMSFGYFL